MWPAATGAAEDKVYDRDKIYGQDRQEGEYPE
jgi:hypothetical protein